MSDNDKIEVNVQIQIFRKLGRGFMEQSRFYMTGPDKTNVELASGFMTGMLCAALLKVEEDKRAAL